MTHCKWHRLFTLLLGSVLVLGMTSGCDSGKEAVDEITGNRAVKQYHKSKNDIEKIAGKQAEKFGKIPNDDKEDEEK